MPEVLQRVDKVIGRIRAAGLIFGIHNWELSCCLFDMWEEAELCGVRLTFSASGARVKWSHVEHSVMLEVQKESPNEEEDLCL